MNVQAFFVLTFGALPGLNEIPLIRLFNFDRLNFNNDPQNKGDGFFDFVPGITVTPQNGKIIFNSFRKGNVIGNHKAIFSSKDEVIELSHEALDRGIFATGAIQAAKWGINKKAGLYSMIDVLEK